MKVSEAILKRKSIRSFLDTPVPQSTVENILKLASRAPSGGNTQPWHCYVVTGSAKTDITDKVFAEFDKGNLGENPEFSIYPKPDASPEFMKRRRKLGYDMYQLLGIGKNDQAKRFQALKNNFDFFGAPVGIFITVDRFTDRNAWGHVGMFLQTVALLAEEFGLSTCFQEAWNSFPSIIYDSLNIPSDKEILWCGLALGYSDTSAKVNELESVREQLSSFSTFHGFETSKL